MSLIKISPETYEKLILKPNGSQIASKFKPYRLYDLETQVNENKKEILLVDKDYLEQISKEFERLIKENE
jgi:hypothetical protein